MKRLIHFFVLHLAFLPASMAQQPTDLRYFMQSSAAGASNVPYGANQAAGRYIQSDDARIYYEVYGRGKTFIVLHGGIVGSPFEMGQFIDSLSKYYQVIAVSTRGHGKSEMGAAAPTYVRKAEDVKAIIDAVSKDSVTVLGFSDGAYIAYHLAAMYPAQVRQVIAIGAGEWRQGFRKFRNTKRTLYAADSMYFEQQLKLMPDPHGFEKWLIATNKVYNSTNVGKGVFSKIKCPVLIMAGELDQNAPLKTIIAAHGMIRNAQLSIIPNAPHPVFLVNFPAVWTSMRPFLNQ